MAKLFRNLIAHGWTLNKLFSCFSFLGVNRARWHQFTIFLHIGRTSNRLERVLLATSNGTIIATFTSIVCNFPFLYSAALHDIDKTSCDTHERHANNLMAHSGRHQCQRLEWERRTTGFRLIRNFVFASRHCSIRLSVLCANRLKLNKMLSKEIKWLRALSGRRGGRRRRSEGESWSKKN